MKFLKMKTLYFIINFESDIFELKMIEDIKLLVKELLIQIANNKINKVDQFNLLTDNQFK